MPVETSPELQAQIDEIAQLKKVGLIKELKRRGLDTKGKQEELAARLTAAVRNEDMDRQISDIQNKKKVAKETDGGFQALHAEEERIAGVKVEREVADSDHKSFRAEVKKMKKPALVKELKKRGLETKGKTDELVARLLEALQDTKAAADEEFAEATMTAVEKRERDERETAEREERERIEAEEERIAAEEEAAQVAAEEEEERLRIEEDEEIAHPGTKHFKQMKANVREMPKKAIKKQLEARELSTKGSHEVLMDRMLAALDDDFANHREQTLAERE
eukprot:SAG22_NODE_1550_length_4145_cov_149.312654_3_plen_277_part_01